jgi:hypothetical protein
LADDLWSRVHQTFCEVAGMDTLAISVSQLQDLEALVAKWWAYKAIVPVMTIEAAEAFNELDDQARRAEKAIREVRGFGS